MGEKQFKKKHERHEKKLKECKTTKEIALIKSLSQCSPAMRNQLEATKNCATIEPSVDVPQLSQLIESIVHSNKGAQHDHWALSFAMRKPATVKQGKREILVSNHHQFNDIAFVGVKLCVKLCRHCDLCPFVNVSSP